MATQLRDHKPVAVINYSRRQCVKAPAAAIPTKETNDENSRESGLPRPSRRLGVSCIYGIVGDSLNGFTDAIRGQHKIEWVHVRHEEVAAFAAGADAHLTGSLAVCAGRAAGRAICTSLTDCSTAIASGVPVLGHRGPHSLGRDRARAISRKRIPRRRVQKKCSHYCASSSLSSA